jgi:drug/metabolite transporter (DMT)-like permease
MRSAVGATQCTTVMLMLGSSFPISRELLGYPVLTGQAMRYAVAAAALAAALYWWRRGRPPVRPTAGELWRLCALGATGLAAFNVCVLETLRRADPAVVGTAVGAAPIALALLGPLTRGQRPAARLAVAAAVVVAGTGLVYGAGNTSVAGLAWASGAFAGEVGFSLIAAPLLARLGPVRVSAYACGFAVPLLLMAALVVGERWQPPTATETAALAFLALILTAGMFPLWYSGVHRLTVERAGMFAGLLPVVSLVATALFDRTSPPPTQLAGVLLVGVGLTVGLATRPAPARVPPTLVPVTADAHANDTKAEISIVRMSIVDRSI